MLAIYTRLSREDEDSSSIEHQTNEGIAFAQSIKLAYKIYNEGEGISGTLDITERPQLLQLMIDVRNQEITHVWFRNSNRLSRNESTYHAFISEMRKYNVKLYFDSKLFDYEDPSQNLMGSILSSLNTYQAKLQSHQTKKVLLNNARQGKFSGILKYGYTKDKNGVVIVEKEEAEIIKKIFDLAFKMGSRKIAQWLNDNEVPTRYKKLKNKDTKWSPRVVENIIKSRVYIGEKEYGGEIIKVPAIISIEKFNSVQEHISLRKNKTGKKTSHKYMLNGLLQCGKCGRRYTGRKYKISRGDYYYYRCTSTITKGTSCGNRYVKGELLENMIWSMFFTNYRFKNFLIEQLKKKEEVRDFDIEIKSLIRQLKSIEVKLIKGIDLIIDGVITREEFGSRKKRLEESKNDIKDRIKKLKEEQEFEIKKDEVVSEIDVHLSKVKTDADFNTKQQVMSKYIKQIKIVYDEKYDCFFLKISSFFNIIDLETTFNAKPFHKDGEEFYQLKLTYSGKKWKEELEGYVKHFEELSKSLG